MKLSLVHNKWISMEETVQLGEAELKELLIGRLSKHLDSEVHSVVDLSMRDITGDRGSLCGLAAVYQAGKDTVLSVSQLKKMSFDDIKYTLAEELGLDPTTVKGINDIDLLESFYSCKYSKLHCVLCCY